ncbi:MAG: SDR family NAD(P)-dependent oxidoreductase [Pseudomonadales bacterium]|nr:SDR family NAD(P)-dependent oxidoreductase [Pseudomonadales bacterium]
MGLSITDKVALVTGGARGIGAGIVATLAGAGARVMVADIGVSAPEATPDATETDWRYSLASDDELRQTLDLPGEITATHVDVTDATSCEAAVAATVARFGQLDILINNAGIVDSGAIEQFEEASWDRIFAVNTKGIFLMTKAALPHLKSSGQGAVVNTASIAGKKGYPNMSAYCGSKFAAIGITQSLSAELAPDNIRVNAICPGMVGTAMWLDHLLPTNATSVGQKNDEFESAMASTIPLGRPQSTQDMGEAVLYLVTAPNVSGVSLAVAGGFEMN